ncbi:MAG TPA: hypothetical protein VLA39_10190 [Marinobacterium sp.]|nr:hypothetical protein [Marinobacterium sp.]
MSSELKTIVTGYLEGRRLEIKYDIFGAECDDNRMLYRLMIDLELNQNKHLDFEAMRQCSSYDKQEEHVDSWIRSMVDLLDAQAGLLKRFRSVCDSRMNINDIYTMPFTMLQKRQDVHLKAQPYTA